MRHRKKLLAAGIAGIAFVALAPMARQAWDERRMRDAEAEQLEFIHAKEREIACLERLQTGGLKKGADVQVEIARCRSQAAGAGEAGGGP